MSQEPLIHDLHIHTNYSPDSTTPLKDYAQAGAQLSIHTGFLDHWELAFLDRKDYLNYESIPLLLEEYDQVHANYPHTSIGLEVDFYSDLSSSIAEFCDNYRKDFDYFIGVIHTVERLAVTSLDDMNLLITRFGLQTVLEYYFQEVEAAIRSKLFDGIAHLDVVMRFRPLYPNNMHIESQWRESTLDLGRLCQKMNVLIEVNLGGLNHPWGHSHPSLSIIDDLVKSGAKFYLGSDSHGLQQFLAIIPHLKLMYAYLTKNKALSLPGRL